MRRVILLVTCLLLGATLLSAKAHQNSITTDTSDYHYYFFLNEELKDVRTFKTVDLPFKKGDMRKLPQKDRLVTYWEDMRTLLFYRYNGSLVGRSKIHSHEMLSPDWKYVIFYQDGDMWAEDIDWLTGQRQNKRQITQLGVFQRFIEPRHWYGNTIIFYADDGMYTLDIGTKEITETSELIKNVFEAYYYHSPDFRYMLTFANTPNPAYSQRGSYDFKKKEFINIFTEPDTEFWLNPTTLFYLNRGEKLFHKVNMETKEDVVIKLSDKPSFGKIMKSNKGWNYHHVSPDRKHFVYYADVEVEVDVYTLNLKVFNLEASKEILWDDDIKETLLASAFMKRDQHMTFQWTSNEHLIYRKDGNLIKQGTWVFNVTDQSKKRITPYMATEIVALEKVGKVVFKANNEIYRCNADGSNLQKMSTEPDKYARLQEFGF